MQDLAPLRGLAIRSPQQLTWLLRAHYSSGASGARPFASSAANGRAQAVYQPQEDYYEDWSPRQASAPAVSREYFWGRHADQASEKDAERYAELQVSHSGALVAARALEVLASQEPGQPANTWHATEQQCTPGQQGAPHAAVSSSGLRPLVFYHSSAQASSHEGQEAVLPPEAYAPVQLPHKALLQGDATAATTLGLPPQDHVTQSAFVDGAVEAIEARRQKYYSRMDLQFQQRRKQPQSPSTAASTVAAAAAAAANCDAVLESAAALAEPALGDAGATGVERCADGPAGPSGIPEPARRPSRGSEVDLICQSLAFGGKGVCKLPGGFTIFCDRALPGERLRARITSVKKTHAVAEKLETLTQHADAVAPLCQHFLEGCGGCAMQNLAYSAQLKAKEQQVVDALSRIGRIAGARSLVLPIKPCAQPFRYRNKMAFHYARETFTPSPRGFGLHRVGNPGQVLPVWDCWLQDEGASRIVQLLTAAVQTHSDSEDLPRLLQSATGKGGPFVQKVTIRTGSDPETGNRTYMVVLHTVQKAVTGGRRRKTSDEAQPEADADSQDRPEGLSRKPIALMRIAAYLEREVPGLVGVLQCSEAASGREKLTQLWGSDHLWERLNGLEFKISPQSFFQTNVHQTETLYRVVADAAGLKGDCSETVLDLYSGTGTIALSLANRSRAVIGLEASAKAVADARLNATHNGVANATFEVADLSDPHHMAAVQRLVPQPDVVIADPARAGLGGPVIDYLMGCGARSLVYVSCDPATQARDLMRLTDASAWPHPFRLHSVRPVDMFPHTAHIESVAVLRRTPRPQLEKK